MKNLKMPKVSIILPAYNAENTIASTIKSVLDSSYENYELLIFDDASTDTTLEKIKQFEKSNSKIRVYTSKKNVGAGNARNYLLSESNGDIIAFIDADDLWYRDKLKLQINLLITRNLSIVTSVYDVRNSSHEMIGRRTPPRFINFFTMHISNWLPTSFTILRSELINSKKMPEIRRRQDYAYWLNIFRSNSNIKCGIINCSTGCYTRHKNSLSSSRRDNLRANYHMFRIIMKYNILLSIALVSINVIIRLFRT